jgi:L-rhamnose mutarotase
METIALHTRIADGHEADYAREHARIPDDLDPALREAGVVTWRIWRDGVDVFHVVEVEDYHAMRAYLKDHPANIAWQEHINQFLAAPDSYEGDDDGIDLVWQLPEVPAGQTEGGR